jgi:hypothetical protein
VAAYAAFFCLGGDCHYHEGTFLHGPDVLFGDSTPDPFTNVVPLPTGQQRGLAHSSERQRPSAITSASRQAGSVVSRVVADPLSVY